MSVYESWKCVGMYMTGWKYEM